MKPVRFTLLLITLAVLLVLSATGSALSGAVRIPLEALPELLMPAAQPDILEPGQSGYGRSDRLPGLCRQAVLHSGPAPYMNSLLRTRHKRPEICNSHFQSLTI